MMARYKSYIAPPPKSDDGIFDNPLEGGDSVLERSRWLLKSTRVAMRKEVSQATGSSSSIAGCCSWLP
ncbi:hypothetical protein V6N11_072314 [Hibiscus sabdariffa]|uniref:Uncharacterized protein n=1 Tax=Hibiscus sabdariffa TaxID=183260 RepID=A0ABR2U2N1_9ROSI